MSPYEILSRTVRAAFPHTALHNNIRIYVLSAILSNFVSIYPPVPEYGKCVLRKSVIMCQPFLYRD